MSEDLVYIYNLEQAYFYIREGLTPLYPPKENKNTRMIYFCFDKGDSNSVYTKWLERGKFGLSCKKVSGN